MLAMSSTTLIKQKLLQVKGKGMHLIFTLLLNQVRCAQTLKNHFVYLMRIYIMRTKNFSILTNSSLCYYENVNPIDQIAKKKLCSLIRSKQDKTGKERGRVNGDFMMIR